MGKASKAIAAIVEQEAATEQEALEVEVEAISMRPADVPADVWDLIQDNGRLATERLNDLLKSPRFMRYKPADQARLIALAQNRAYGTPKSNRADTNKRRGGMTDVTAASLRGLVSRATLPEYRQTPVPDADVKYDKP